MIDCSDKLLMIDADTLLYSAAAKEEINKCLAKHLPTGREKLFESKTEFNNWLKSNQKWKKEDFEFTQIKELKPPYEEWNEVGEDFSITTHRREVSRIALACHTFKSKVSAIVEAIGAKDYFVCIQGSGNFRKEVDAKYVQYKAQRTEKPLLMKELTDWVKVKYKHRCIIVDGEETDDFVVRKAYDGHVVAFCDKDIPANCSGLLYNYNKPEEGVFENTDEMRWRGYWTQCLIGDAVDNIEGVVKLAELTKKAYNIKNKGCGEASAAKILETAASEKEAAERVVKAYKEAWPDDGMKRLAEISFFLWMRRHEGQMFSLKEYLDKLGVEYGS